MRLAGRLQSTQILTQEILPGLAPYVRWLRTPLASLGSAAIASLLCGMLLHPQGFVLGFGITGMIALGLIWPKLSLLGLAGSIRFEKSRVREGERVAVRASIRNRYPTSAWGIAIHAGTRRSDSSGLDDLPETGLAVAFGWKTTETSWDFIPDCRGEYPLHPPVASSGFPFGLWVARRGLANEGTLLVWPRTFSVGPVPASTLGHGSLGLALCDKPGTWGDLLGVRPYRRGDSLRRIHWPQTARHGQLVVCEVQSSAVSQVQVVLDAHQSSHVGSAPDGTREWAIRVAASLVEGWTLEGVEVELVLDGSSLRQAGSSPRNCAAAVLDALARLGTDTRNTLRELLQFAGCGRNNPGLRVIVTTDLGLGSLSREEVRERGDHFVVLKAGGFGGARDAPSTGFPIAPWIVIECPDTVAQSLRRTGTEAALVV